MNETFSIEIIGSELFPLFGKRNAGVHVSCGGRDGDRDGDMGWGQGPGTELGTGAGTRTETGT